MELFDIPLDVEYVTEQLVSFLPKAGAALLVLAAFWLVVKVTRPSLRHLLRRSDFDDVLVKLLVDNVYRFSIMTIAIVMAASQLGIDVGAAVAGLGVAGIAVGFAAKDTLSNTISGFLIFWDKPFRVDDYVTTQGFYGKVTNITLRTTRVQTTDNTYVIVPNSQIIEDVLVNHSLYGNTRVRVPLGIAYKSDLTKAREVLLTVAREANDVLSDPEPEVVLAELGDSSLDLELRAWIRDASIERQTKFGLLESCKKALDNAGIEIPFPHRQLLIQAESNGERADAAKEFRQRRETVPTVTSGRSE